VARLALGRMVGKTFPSGFLCRHWPEVVEEETGQPLRNTPEGTVFSSYKYCLAPSASAEEDLSFS